MLFWSFLKPDSKKNFLGPEKFFLKKNFSGPKKFFFDPISPDILRDCWLQIGKPQTFFSISPHSTISRPQANSSTSSPCKCHDWLQLYGYAITRTYLQIFDLSLRGLNFGFWFRHEGAISGKWCCTRGRRGRKYYILARNMILYSDSIHAIFI